MKKIISLIIVVTLVLSLSLFVKNTKADSTFESRSEYSWVYERTNSEKVDGSNYRTVLLENAFSDAPMCNGTEEYWGISVKNLIGSEYNLRYAFSMGGGQICWIPSSGTAYLVSISGSVTKQTYTDVQYVKIPANFEGDIFVKKDTLINYSHDTVSTNKYRIKGVKLGIDFRQATGAKVALNGVSICDISDDLETINVTNYAFKKNFDDVSSQGSVQFLGSVASDVQTTCNNRCSFTKIANSQLNGHTCTSVCPTCGKCLNENCNEQACSDKCLGHEIDTTEAYNGFYLHKDFGKVSNSNYYGSDIVVDFADAYKAEGTEEYWGIKVQNLDNFSTRLRFGYPMGGGKTCWIGPEGTKLYIVSGETVTEWTMPGAQYVDVPANFDGYIYAKKTDLYGYTDTTVSDNKYRIKGIAAYVDYRLDYEANLVFKGVAICNINELVVSDYSFVLNFDNVTGITGKGINSSISADAITAISSKFSISKVTLETMLDDASIVVTAPTKVNYQVGDNLDLTGATITLITECGYKKNIAIDNTNVTVTGYDNSQEATDLTVTVNYKELSDTFTVNLTALPPHVCGHVCPECGKCLDNTCLDSACADKCLGHVVTEGDYGFYLERSQYDYVDGSNYIIANIATSFENAPKANGEEKCWGLDLVNLSDTAVRIRYGFIMGGGRTCWIGPSDTYAYLVDEAGNVTEFKINSSQYVTVPANFKGTIYLNKEDLYKYNDQAVIDNKYRIKGVQIGYDYRMSYTANLIISGVRVANINSGVVSDNTFILNFDDINDVTYEFLGSVSEDIKSLVYPSFSATKVLLERSSVISSISVSKIPQNVFVLNEEFNYIGGEVFITYSDGVSKNTYLENDDFQVSGYDATSTGVKQITVKYGNFTTTYDVTILEKYPSADDEEGQYVLIDRFDSTMSSYTTGWLYTEFATEKWLEEGKNATGKGNCLAVRIENVSEFASNMRIVLRTHNANDEENAATHRTGMWNNANAFVWFVPDGSTKCESLAFSKTGQVIAFPAKTSGTLYLRYDTDFSWKGHTSGVGISHIAIGIDMRGTGTPKLVLKEVYDAEYIIKSNATFTDLQDENDNAAGVNTHFTTDVILHKFERFINTKNYSVDNIPIVEEPDSTIKDCRKPIEILLSTNYAQWKTVTDQLLQEEAAKVQIVKYDPTDYIPVSMELKVLPKINYVVGDLSSFNDGVVTITYQSGRTQDYSLGSNRFIVTGFNSLQPNEELEITVLLASNQSINFTFNVEVLPAPDPVTPKKSGCGSAIASTILSTLGLASIAFVLRRKKENE